MTSIDVDAALASRRIINLDHIQYNILYINFYTFPLEHRTQTKRT